MKHPPFSFFHKTNEGHSRGFREHQGHSLLNIINRSFAHDTTGKSVNSATASDWISQSNSGGSPHHVDLLTGTNGWATPPAHLFFLRSKNYFTKTHKSPSADYLLSPAGMDWLKSTTKLDNVLITASHRPYVKPKPWAGLSRASFFAVNLQVPGKDHYSAVFYFLSVLPAVASPMKST